jgi:hypothetical protein
MFPDSLSAAAAAMFVVNRCLAHIINLATQAVITSYSKSKHYDPTDPEADLTGPRTERGRDEVGLVRAICVKVSSSPGVSLSRNSRVLTSFVVGSFFSKAETITHRYSRMRRSQKHASTPA